MFVHLFGSKSLSARPFINAIACYSGAIAGYLKQWFGATGLVWRDRNGNFLRAQAQYERAANPLTMEALVICDGVMMALERALQHVHIETDAQQCQVVGDQQI